MLPQLESVAEEINQFVREYQSLVQHYRSCLAVAPLSNIVKGRKRGIHKKQRRREKGLEFHHLFHLLKTSIISGPPRDDDGKKQLTEQQEVIQDEEECFFILKMKVRTPG